MKKSLLVLLVFSVFFACNKKKKDPPAEEPADTTAPVLKLKGNKVDTVSLQVSVHYVDSFVVATDDRDTLIQSRVATTGTVNMNLAGTYTLSYKVSDEAGNAAVPLSRTVTVVNDARHLAGIYDVVPNCGTLTAGPYTTTVTASANQNRVLIFSQLLYNNTGQTPSAAFNAAGSFTIATLTDASGNVFDGSGSRVSPGIFSLSSRSGNSSGSFFCTSILTKR